MPKQSRTASSRPVAKTKPAARVQPKRQAVARPTRRPSSAGRRRQTTKPPSRKPAIKAPAKLVVKAAAKPAAKVPPKPAVKAASKPDAKPVPRTAAKAAAKPAAGRVPSRAHQAAAPAGPAAREQAVEAFERGFRALQQRQFDRAASALKTVVNGFPDEKELQERARVYLSICERQLAGARPRSFEEKLNAATVSINRGAIDDSLRLLRDLEADNPLSDHVQYLLTVAFTSTGDIDKALSHLRRAIELNPENRFLSKSDADLEPLRQHAGFLAASEAHPASSAPRRRSAARGR